MLQCKQWECECSNIKSSESSHPRITSGRLKEWLNAHYEMCISLVESKYTRSLLHSANPFKPSVFSIPTDCPFPITVLKKERKRFPFYFTLYGDTILSYQTNTLQKTLPIIRSFSFHTQIKKYNSFILFYSRA